MKMCDAFEKSKLNYVANINIMHVCRRKIASEMQANPWLQLLFLIHSSFFVLFLSILGFSSVSEQSNGPSDIALFQIVGFAYLCLFYSRSLFVYGTCELAAYCVLLSQTFLSRFAGCSPFQFHMYAVSVN